MLSMVIKLCKMLIGEEVVVFKDERREVFHSLFERYTTTSKWQKTFKYSLLIVQSVQFLVHLKCTEFVRNIGIVHFVLHKFIKNCS